MATLPKCGSYGQGQNGINTLYFEDSNGNWFYYSYKTIVAFIHKGKLYCCENVWTVTTGKHLGWIESDKSKRLRKCCFEAKFKECFGVEYESNY